MAKIRYQTAPLIVGEHPRGYTHKRIELTPEQAAEVRGHFQALSVSYTIARCERSGNPPNTDTVPVDQPCTCRACTLDRSVAGAPFVLDANDPGGRYAQPLAFVGPVQSGTLREVKR